MSEIVKKPCAWCYYSRMRKDICGIYCTGGFQNPDGTCNHFQDYQEQKKEQRRKRKEINKNVGSHSLQ